MSKQQDQEQVTWLVREAIDREFVREGLEKGIPEEITRQQLEESRLMEDRYEALLAKGHSEAQIDVLWAGKTPQEIIAGTGMNVTTSQTEKEEGNVDNLADKLTQALHKLQDDKIDAVINAFLALGSWDSIRPTPRGAKINDFVIWAHRAGKQEEAYQRAVNPR